ncbi:MAG: GAF domain-containing protein [Gemmatimonadetes bacterium]|nr:GAF domain-containing protein [Gemmatimonadota bacterium]
MTTPTRSITPARGLDEATLAALAGLEPAHADRLRALVRTGDRRGAALAGVQQLVMALARATDEEVILDEVARGAQRILGVRGVLVLDFDEPDRRVTVRRRLGDDAIGFELPAGDGGDALTETWRTGTPLLLRRESPPEAVLLDATWQRDPPLEGMLLLPMVHGRKLFGALVGWSDEAGILDEEAREIGTTLAVVAGTAINNARLHMESERERRQSDAMAEVARAVGESLKVTEVQRLILRHAMALLRAAGACTALRDGDYLYVQSAAGIADVFTGVVVPVQGSLMGQVVLSGATAISNDVTADPGAYHRNLQLVDVRRAVIAPLRTARGIIGVLALFNRDEAFHEGDARILQRLADQVAVAIVNARLFAEIQEATREWSSIFDAIGVGMVVVNEEGRVLRCNVRARQLTGDETTFGLIGRSFYAAVLGLPHAPANDPLRAAIEEGARGRARCRHASGELEVDIIAMPHPDGGAVVTFDPVESPTHG